MFPKMSAVGPDGHKQGAGTWWPGDTTRAASLGQVPVLQVPVCHQEGSEGVRLTTEEELSAAGTPQQTRKHLSFSTQPQPLPASSCFLPSHVVMIGTTVVDTCPRPVTPIPPAWAAPAG